MESPHLYCLDDDDDDLELFQQAATSLGYNVSLFKTLLALTVAVEKAAPYAIFLDIHMPLVGGEEALGILKKNSRWQTIPVMMISSASPKKLVKYYIELGAVGIMKKPHGATWDTSLAQAMELLHPIMGASDNNGRA